MVLGITILSFVTNAKEVGFELGFLHIKADWVVFLAFGLGFTGLAAPSIFIYFLRGVTWVQHKIGRLITFILLSIVFYLILTPIAFLANLSKKKKTGRARKIAYV